MKKRPKTFKFSELFPDLSLRTGPYSGSHHHPHHSPQIEGVTADARRGGTLCRKRPGRPWGPAREERFRQKAEGVIAAIRSALAAGCTPAEIAAVLGVPEQVVADYRVEV